MEHKLFKIIALIFARYYFKRKEMAAPICHFLERIGWAGIVKEGLAQLSFLLATEKCMVLPRVVRFEVTNRCNLKCPMCPQAEKMTRPKNNMEFQNFKNVIDHNPQIKEVELFNWGEPLMNPDIAEFVRYASLKNILTRFVTNATLLNAKKAVQLVEAGLNEIYFSLDNIDDGYEKIRKHSFDIVIENIESFLKIAAKSGRKIRTGVNMVRSQHNNTGIARAVRLFESMDVDIVSVEQSQFEEEMTRNSRCFEPYRNITILSNGDVVPCCVDYDGVLSMGSAWEEPNLEKIFNNPAYRRLRRSFRFKKDMHTICKQCTYRTVSLDL